MENNKKKSGIGSIILKVLLVLLVLLAVGGIAAYFKIRKAYNEYTEEINQQMNTIVGSEAPSFTLELTDGTQTSLEQLLEGKDLLVVNVFATWCGPCEAEFPEFEKFYQKYGDKVEMISVSNSSLDNPEDIVSYRESHGLSFKMAKTDDDTGLFNVASYPTTYVIDRNGKVGFCQSGYFTSGEYMEKVFTAFMGDNYTEKQVALYAFNVRTDKELVEGAQLQLHSDTVDEIVTTDKDGMAYLFTENPHVIDVSIVSLPEGYKGGDGVVGQTSATLSGWTVITVKK